MLQGLQTWVDPESNFENTYPYHSLICNYLKKKHLCQYFLNWIISVKKDMALNQG